MKQTYNNETVMHETRHLNTTSRKKINENNKKIKQEIYIRTQEKGENLSKNFYANDS